MLELRQFVKYGSYSPKLDDSEIGYVVKGCRCREPVKYVREVNDRFVAYAMAVP